MYNNSDQFLVSRSSSLEKNNNQLIPDHFQKRLCVNSKAGHLHPSSRKTQLILPKQAGAGSFRGALTGVHTEVIYL